MYSTTIWGTIFNVIVLHCVDFVTSTLRRFVVVVVVVVVRRSSFVVRLSAFVVGIVAEM